MVDVWAGRTNKWGLVSTRYDSCPCCFRIVRCRFVRFVGGGGDEDGGDDGNGNDDGKEEDNSNRSKSKRCNKWGLDNSTFNREDFQTTLWNDCFNISSAVLLDFPSECSSLAFSLFGTAVKIT